jgi:polar amino acid transport system permease protein/polar amino acid transport system substrate-binding protein
MYYNIPLSISSFFQNFKDTFILNFIEKDRWKYVLKGLGNTLLITLFACIIGVVVGVIVAAIRSSYDKNEEALKLRGGVGFKILKILNGICKFYLTIIRGTPVVVQLLICYFIIFKSAKNGVPVAIFAFGLNSGAYVAEIFRGGIMSIDTGQFEAGRSIGFNYLQTMRYIIIPQMFKTVLPTLLNEFIALLKETSVAGYVAIPDLTKAGNSIAGTTYSYYMPLITVALIYLALVIILTKLVGILERRLRKNER